MAPTICATMRPANEIQADRTLSFFFFFFSTLCSVTAALSMLELTQKPGF
jgi:hypothetical protein